MKRFLAGALLALTMAGQGLSYECRRPNPEYIKLQNKIYTLKQDLDRINYQIDSKRWQLDDAKQRCRDAEATCRTAKQQFADFNRSHGCSEMLGCIKAINRKCGYGQDGTSLAYGPTSEQQACIQNNQWLNHESDKLREQKNYVCNQSDDVCRDARQIENEIRDLRWDYESLSDQIGRLQSKLDRIPIEISCD